MAGLELRIVTQKSELKKNANYNYIQPTWSDEQEKKVRNKLFYESYVSIFVQLTCGLGLVPFLLL